MIYISNIRNMCNPFPFKESAIQKNDKNITTYTHQETVSNPITSEYNSELITYHEKRTLAHQCGLNSISLKIIQAPSTENNNTCICEATVITLDGKQFSDIGNASPDNVPPKCNNMIIDIASTRAKSRVLSDAFNISSENYNKSNMIDITPIQNNKLQQNNYTFQNHQNNNYTHTNKSKMNGGGSKMISSKQIKFIDNLASQKNTTGNDLSISTFQKPLEFISGQEANILIKKLKR